MMRAMTTFMVCCMSNSPHTPPPPLHHPQHKINASFRTAKFRMCFRHPAPIISFPALSLSPPHITGTEASVGGKKEAKGFSNTWPVCAHTAPAIIAIGHLLWIISCLL